MSEIHRSATIGVIAKQLDASVHQVTYIIKTRGIEPTTWAGNARVFDEQAVDEIERELERVRNR